MLEIGPVLQSDDAVANKMAALYGRALARDFLDNGGLSC
jgi:predicted nucleotidyltransferase component of viral defense system